MNKITAEIISELLEEEFAWDKKTRELNYHAVVDTYHEIREHRFYDEIYWPRILRAMRLIKAMGIFPEDIWSEETFGWYEEYTGWWPIYAPDINERFCEEITYKNGKWRQTYFNKFWTSEDWAWEQPEEEEILALGIKPNLVPKKRDRLGNLQPSMF